MTGEMLSAGFGNCSNHYECESVCPKGIKVKFIAKLNREFIKAQAPGSGCRDGEAERETAPADEED
jgi:succinate dehydrogenase / fumarate reductase iron-sulfur subunit